jgi:hypothetical protein
MLSANASLRDVALDEVCVPRMLRSALRIAFRDSGGALLIRGPWLQKVGPGSAVHREERCTASGTRADIHVPASRSRKTWMAGTSCVKTRFALLPGHDERGPYFNVIASPLRSTLAINPTWRPDNSSTAPFWLVSTIARAPPPTARPAPAAP